jgi:hypothetical protein
MPNLAEQVRKSCDGGAARPIPSCQHSKHFETIQKITQFFLLKFRMFRKHLTQTYRDLSI